jgi:MYXO-CTERM domain-containing protein
MCASGPGGMKCTQACVPGATPSSCPDGFECLSTGTGGACWPGDGGGGDDDDDGAGGADNGSLTGGCGCTVGSAGGRGGLGGLVAFLLVAAPLARRRSRRRS